MTLASTRANAHDLIPGGAHTYAKGDDQWPEHAPSALVGGRGCRVWDAEGNEFIEYGSGNRAVTLGHAGLCSRSLFAAVLPGLTALLAAVPAVPLGPPSHRG